MPSSNTHEPPRARARRGRLARHERLRIGRGRRAGEVEQAAGDERRRPVGEDAAQPGREVRDGDVGGERQLEHRVAEQLRPRADSHSRQSEQRVVLALVERLTPRQPRGARDPRGGADVARDRDLVAPARGPGERVTLLEPRSSGQPGSWRQSPRCSARSGSGASVPDEHLDRRLVVDAVRLVGEPAAEPADQLGDEVEVRAGQRRRRRHVAQGPISSRFGHVSALERAEVVVAVAVGPAADEHRRAGDPLVARPRVASATEPCRQYGPSTCSSSQRRSHGSLRRRGRPSAHASRPRERRHGWEHVASPPCRGRSRSRRSP